MRGKNMFPLFFLQFYLPSEICIICLMCVFPYFSVCKAHINTEASPLFWFAKIKPHYILIIILLKDNCFTEFCGFLSYINKNQP